MTPEILTAVRAFLIALGGGLVGKGIMSEALVEAGIGLIMVLLPFAWALWAKRPESSEAVKIAERVAESDAPQASGIAKAGELPLGQAERRNL